MFAGKIWWITGASSGIGTALAEALAKKDARLILSGRNTEALEDVAKRCATPSLVLPFEATDFAAIPSIVDRASDWAARNGGAIYGLASHGRMHGGFKPKNRSRVYRNLYLTGGSANPGPGTPMVMMSGVTAANCVLEDWKIPLPTEGGRSVASMLEAKAEAVTV